jgi:hypothetical protein
MAEYISAWSKEKQNLMAGKTRKNWATMRGRTGGYVKARKKESCERRSFLEKYARKNEKLLDGKSRDLRLKHKYAKGANATELLKEKCKAECGVVVWEGLNTERQAELLKEKQHGMTDEEKEVAVKAKEREWSDICAKEKARIRELELELTNPSDGNRTFDPTLKYSVNTSTSAIAAGLASVTGASWTPTGFRNTPTSRWARQTGSFTAPGVFGTTESPPVELLKPDSGRESISSSEAQYEEQWDSDMEEWGWVSAPAQQHAVVDERREQWNKDTEMIRKTVRDLELAYQGARPVKPAAEAAMHFALEDVFRRRNNTRVADVEKAKGALKKLIAAEDDLEKQAALHEKLVRVWVAEQRADGFWGKKWARLEKDRAEVKKRRGMLENAAKRKHATKRQALAMESAFGASEDSSGSRGVSSAAEYERLLIEQYQYCHENSSHLRVNTNQLPAPVMGATDRAMRPALREQGNRGSSTKGSGGRAMIRAGKKGASYYKEGSERGHATRACW